MARICCFQNDFFFHFLLPKFPKFISQPASLHIRSLVKTSQILDAVSDKKMMLDDFHDFDDDGGCMKHLWNMASKLLWGGDIRCQTATIAAIWFLHRGRVGVRWQPFLDDTLFDFTLLPHNLILHLVLPHGTVWFDQTSPLMVGDIWWHMVPDNRGGVKRQQLRNQLKLCSFFNFSTSSLNISNSKERWSGFQDFGDAPKFQNWCLESLQNWMYTFPQLISSTSWRPFWPLECWPTQITSYSPTTTNWLWLHENTNMLKVLILGCGIKGHLKNFQKSNMVHTLPYPTRNWKTTTRWGLYSVYNTTPIQLQYIIGF